MAAAVASASDGDATRLLKEVEQRLHLTPSYKIGFKLVGEGVSGEGTLHVEGDCSYLRFGAEEIYIANGVRHIVGLDKREVVIDSNSAYRNDLFSNPSLGFKALATDSDATLTTLDSRRAIRLLPKGGATLDEAIILVVRDDASIERVVVGGEEAHLNITPTKVEHDAGAVPRYDSSRYAGFEVMDFR